MRGISDDLFWAARRRREGGWSLRRVRPHPQRDRSHHPSRSSGVHRGEPSRAQDLPDPWAHEPLRDVVSHQQHEDARRACEEDRGAGGEVGAG